MAHDDRACEERDDPWKAEQFANQIGDIASQEDETGLFDWIPIERFIDFEQIAEAEACNGPDGDAEEHQDQEFYDHVHDCIETA